MVRCAIFFLGNALSPIPPRVLRRTGVGGDPLPRGLIKKIVQKFWVNAGNNLITEYYCIFLSLRAFSTPVIFSVMGSQQWIRMVIGDEPTAEKQPTPKGRVAHQLHVRTHVQAVLPPSLFAVSRRAPPTAHAVDTLRTLTSCIPGKPTPAWCTPSIACTPANAYSVCAVLKARNCSMVFFGWEGDRYEIRN